MHTLCTVHTMKHHWSFGVNSEIPMHLMVKSTFMIKVIKIIWPRLTWPLFFHFSRYKLRFLETNEAMIKDEQNKEQLKKFLDQFCRYMIDSIREGMLVSVNSPDTPCVYFTMTCPCIFANIHVVAILSKPCISISGGKWLFVFDRFPGVLLNWWWYTISKSQSERSKNGNFCVFQELVCHIMLVYLGMWIL